MLLAVYQEWQLSNLLTQRPGIRQMSFRDHWLAILAFKILCAIWQY